METGREMKREEQMTRLLFLCLMWMRTMKLGKLCFFTGFRLFKGTIPGDFLPLAPASKCPYNCSDYFLLLAVLNIRSLPKYSNSSSYRVGVSSVS
jgi:hypothetical protein